MKVICEYCESYLDSTDATCPNCGAPNAHFVRTASDTPRTIQQLLDFCSKKNLHLEKMHVHINEDYRQPKAFGIYKDYATGNFIVYKNKESGERAIRYEGTDEAYAVNEIYMKIKDLVMDARENATQPPRRENNYAPENTSAPVKSGRSKIIKWIIIAAVIALLIGGGFKGLGRGLSFFRGIFNGGSYYESSIGDGGSSYDNDGGGNWFQNLFDSSNDWDTDDDWDSDTDWGWSDSYDSYDFGSSSDWDSDW